MSDFHFQNLTTWRISTRSPLAPIQVREPIQMVLDVPDVRPELRLLEGHWLGASILGPSGVESIRELDDETLHRNLGSVIGREPRETLRGSTGHQETQRSHSHVESGLGDLHRMVAHTDTERAVSERLDLSGAQTTLHLEIDGALGLGAQNEDVTLHCFAFFSFHHLVG